MPIILNYAIDFNGGHIEYFNLHIVYKTYH